MTCRGHCILITVFLVLLCAGGSDAHALQPASDRSTPESPGARRGHVAVFDADRSVVVILGGHAREQIPDRERLWAWDGDGWRILDEAGPSPRTLTAGAYLETANALIVHGGIDPRDLGRLYDGWRWSDEGWSLIGRNRPGFLDHHAAAYDRARQTVVVFGGQNEDRALSDSVWEYDGHSWTEREVDGPPLRAHHAMAYDPNRGGVVVYGGIDDSGQRFGDAWIWNGAVWRQIDGSGPVARSHHRMAYDETREQIVLYGGRIQDESGEAVILEDTWILDETGWRRADASGPGLRSLHAMAYDRLRERVVLYGGSERENDDSVWEWDGRTWLQTH